MHCCLIERDYCNIRNIVGLQPEGEYNLFGVSFDSEYGWLAFSKLNRIEGTRLKTYCV